MQDIGELIRANKVRVLGPDGSSYRLCGVDVVHDEVQLTVVPAAPSVTGFLAPWVVAEVLVQDPRVQAARTFTEAIGLAKPARGDVVVVWEVQAADAENARAVYARGNQLFQIVWLGT